MGEQRKADNGRYGIVALNNGAADTFTFKTSAADGTTFTDQLSGKTYTVENGKLTIDLAENGSVMMIAE